ncbi:hypothetical protein GWC77_21545 [Paraburkholderia sp. NMBU_R16]|uniref:hypothetical protein n=1 Tax=Paraburkholderia sp. NMBU_R16 TaxID=2698676 RepID=UPI0015631A9B|nr:hypothetical protein [Paraburkholderia sp. NMBU_R16]NRO98512.1 hypothetical protein [Paraburkholderia sp. NMBU_R16]
MRQTVVGVYDGYADACAAQRALTEAGLSQADISIYAASVGTSSTGGPRVYAPGGTEVRREKPVFDQLEQLFSRLFKPGEYPPETEDYREVIRRGGAIVSVDVPEVQTDLACDVMRRTGADDIAERAKAWRDRLDEQSRRAQDEERTMTSRTESPLASAPQQSLGQQQHQSTNTTEGTAASVGNIPAAGGTPTPHATPSSMPAPSSRMQQVSTRTDDRTPLRSNEPGQPGLSSGVPGDASDVFEREPQSAGTARESEGSPSDSDRWRDEGVKASGSQYTPGAGYAGDPGMDTPFSDDSEYDEEFRRDYDSRYANADAPYDDYRRAYIHGMSVAQDEQNHGRDWSQVEAHARKHWETRYPESAWERFKAAVRHGWERMTDKR